MYKGKRILLVDNDVTLLQVLKATLEADGYAVSVASSGEQGLRVAYALDPDLILLDIMMPGMDGWEVCRRIRQMSDVPIIMLTALYTPADTARGLQLGADDYVTKPIHHRVLVARIEAIFRRMEKSFPLSDSCAYDDGVLKVDLCRQQAYREGTPIHLTPKEFALLGRLMETPGQVVPHEELLTCVWGPTYSSDTRYLSVYISYLRKKLEADPPHPRYILTRWRVGYLFNPGGERAAGAEPHRS